MANLGGSLKVASVQELANQKFSSVPPRYVRADQDHPFNLQLHDDFSDHHSTASKEIPLIDMHKLLFVEDEDVMNLELQKLHFACKEWGFFQIINHGVSSSVVEKIKEESEEFFHLPLEDKEKFGHAANELEGFGQAFVVSEEQKLDWADRFHIVTQPTYLRKPHLLPKLQVSFREALEAFSAEVESLAMKIFNLMAKALGMKVEEMSTLFDEGLMQAVRMNHYPPCPQPELVIGLCPHSDVGALTILLQVSEVEGLQVRKDGSWVPVQPLPNAFIVNLGDILEIVTNGIYKSVEHRATVTSNKERISIAAFHNPTLKTEFGPALSLIKPEDPPKFKRISVTDYFKGYFSRELSGKSYLDTMKV